MTSYAGVQLFRSCSSLSDSTDFERLGAAIGTGFLSDSGAPRSNAGGVGTGVGIWSIISLFISLSSVAGLQPVLVDL